MEQKQYKYTLSQICLIIFFLIFIIFTIIWINKNIIYYAKLSVISECEPQIFKTTYPDYYMAGAFNVTFEEESNNFTITLMYVDEKPLRSIIKHEECHLRQFKQNRLGNCNNRRLLLLNEIECYTIQRFWELFE